MKNIDEMLKEYYEGLWTVTEVIAEANENHVSAEKRNEVLSDMLLDWQTMPFPTYLDQGIQARWISILEAELAK